MVTRAKESRQVQKARRKLKHQIAEENKHMTPKALQKMRRVIEYWISRHYQDRVTLKNKEISVFDENKHPAKIHSKFITNLMKNIKQLAPEQVPLGPLTGRISQP